MSRRRARESRSPAIRVWPWVALVLFLGTVAALGLWWRKSDEPREEATATNSVPDPSSPAPESTETERTARVARVEEQIRRLAARQAGMEPLSQERWLGLHLNRNSASLEVLNELEAGWQALCEDAAGTAYQDYVSETAETLGRWKEREADRHLGNCRLAVSRAGRRGEWDDGARILDEAAPVVADTPAAEALAKFRADFEEERRTREGKRTLLAALEVVRKDSGEGILVSPGARLEIQEPYVRLVRQNDDLFLGFTTNRASVLRLRFPVERLPRTVTLGAGHLSALGQDSAYSPITIRINEKVLVGNWSPPFTAWGGETWWDVTEYVAAGTNEITWQLGDATTVYWLYWIEVIGDDG